MNKLQFFPVVALFATFSLVLKTSDCFSQTNNLYFNQALYIQSGTVPANKVWKIERIVNINNYADYVYINGTYIGVLNGYANGISANPSTFSSAFTGPIWLPAGSTVGNAAAGMRFSIIEFDVAP